MLIKKRLTLIIIVLLLYPLNVYTQTTSKNDEYSEKVISSTIKLVEQELEGFRKSKANEIASKEIDQIAEGISRAKRKLAAKKLEEAYYTIEITKALFSKIDARMELYYSEQVLSSTKKRLGK